MALIDMCKENNVKEVYLHLFTDGRDTGVTTGKGFVNEVEKKLQEEQDTKSKNELESGKLQNI